MFHNRDLLKANDKAECKHCGSANASGSLFCCHGCELAHQLISSLELENYYRIGAQFNQLPPKVDLAKSKDFALFDSEEFQEGFSCLRRDERLEVNLYVGKLSCYACVWVCEKAISQIDDCVEVSVNLATGRAVIIFDPKQVKLSQIVERFYQLGYPVSPDADHKGEDRSDLAKIGVAAFSFMNIMLLAIADYTHGESISPEFFQLFRWISLVLAAFTLAFPARDFYVNALRALIKKQIHMDLPISIALVSSFLLSSFHVIQGSGAVYFDSLAAIIFLLLSGRFYQKLSMRKHLRRSALGLNEQADFVRVVSSIEDHHASFKKISELKTWEIIRVLAGECIPVKAKLLSDAEISLELMTGEENIRYPKKGAHLRAGSVSLKNVIHLIALEDGSRSYLNSLKQAASKMSSEKTHMAFLSQKMSQLLSVLVLIVGITTFIALISEPSEAISRFTTILLIACPCAFGLGVPLILARSFDLGLRSGVIWNNARSIENLSKVKNFYFDKTGTLTEPLSKLQAIYWDLDVNRYPGVYEILSVLDGYSSHHVVKALSAYLREARPVDDLQIPKFSVEEHVGEGLRIVFSGGEIRIGSYGFTCSKEEKSTYHWISLDFSAIAHFSLEEKVRSDSKELIEGLSKQGIRSEILSGDSDSRVLGVLTQVGLGRDSGLGGLSPSSKIAQIAKKSTSPSAMVGNGFNDSAAIAKADLGIAVRGAAELAQKHADIVLAEDRLSAILDAISISRRSKKALKRSFAFSVVYNLIGMSLGVLGLISPIVAALLMPVSSATIITLARRW